MKNLFIEVADTPIKREYGLMDRKHLSSNSGMLFKFPNRGVLKFWMRNTYIPLDIAFIGDNGEILQIEEMSPLSTKEIRSKHACRYALEVNHGWFKENGIDEGAYVWGEGFPKLKFAQVMGIDPLTEEVPPGLEEDYMQGMEPEPEPAPGPDPDVMLNLTTRERLKYANLKGWEVIIVYQKKDGFTLPPKIIAPPFEFKADSEGRHGAIVTAWDYQEGQWKSFLIDNILSMQEKAE